MTNIRLLQTIEGTFHNDPRGVVKGQIVRIDNYNAQRYIKAGIAEPVDPDELAHY